MALSLCHSDYTKNKQRILRYLIPVEMNKGNFPSEDLLQRYELAGEYSDVVKACIKGDMMALETTLTLNQETFIQSGVFITVERLRMVTLRNYVRRVANAVKADEEL